MKVSLNVIKEFTPVAISIEDLVAKINSQLGGVERVSDTGKKYNGATIVKIVSCEKHPNADKLSVCSIDAGNSEPIQVVCGAPNVHADMYAVWLPPESTVPSSFDDKEPFVLGARELRGVMSNGMLASAKELGLGDSHDGILEIDPAEWKPTSIEIKPGVGFAEAYGLNDITIDIENKMFTHRPDLFGQLGVAREIAGIQQQSFTSPDWYGTSIATQPTAELAISAFNDATEKAPRFMAVVLKNVSLQPSPLWLQCQLVRMGAKPINNVVDITNYMMLLTAQPTHAYDYDSLKDHTIGARFAKQGETITLLNHKTYQLDESDIIIADGEKPIGLAGIMGGSETEVSSSTKNIVLEVANFNMYAVRKSSMRHGIFTDALTRFNKGQSALQTDIVLHRLVQLMQQVAGGEVASKIIDLHDMKQLQQDSKTIDVAFINARLGLDLRAEDVARLLQNVEFSVTVQDDEVLSYRAPFWRTDIELPEDIVEEVGRLYGFDKLPRELPSRSINPPVTNASIVLKNKLRTALASYGANEVLTYSFVNEKIIQHAEQDPADAYRLTNALSPDLQYYRLSVLPSLLSKIRMNVKNGFDEFVLFELGKGHTTTDVDAHGLPFETELLDIAYVHKNSQDGASYYKIRRYVEELLGSLHLAVMFTPIEDELSFASMKPFDVHRSSFVTLLDGSVIGIVGEIKPSVKQNFKLPQYAAGASLFVENIEKAVSAAANAYRPLSKFPSTSQDLSLRVADSTKYQEIVAIVRRVIAEHANLTVDVSLQNIYKPEQSDQKTITVRFKATSFERTLQDADVATVITAVVEAAKNEIGAEKA